MGREQKSAAPHYFLQEEESACGSLHSSESLGRMRQGSGHQPPTYNQDPTQGYFWQQCNSCLDTNIFSDIRIV